VRRPQERAVAAIETTRSSRHNASPPFRPRRRRRRSRV
jgi:hypothetical protein